MKRLKNPDLLVSDPLWYKDAIIYEIPVRAFFDGNDDGCGDFLGLVEKLEYVQDLGVSAIWLLPFYPSPLRDGGYDIANFTDVHSMYGTLKDFQRFLDEAHLRGIRVITELVINHTSAEHPWFQRARRAPPGSRWRNFYVWSDSPEKYADTRVIFQDFETSNWTWDPVAKAYYWHRFYSHQPDLNFDSPDVRKAIYQILDFWLSRGVDGLRLDAIPYLYEREGTNCENLDETHTFLQELRAHVDKKWADRMLLAEANQWPEDAASYFGGGDECHMNFHFPLMPRMFMALQLESSFPILDIMDQTPEIPENCQWAIFLRNHDELTLEMVTDEDRDFMYRMYADDPRARVNLGIRRRLAPLLKERRKIELMNALLFSMPGTPVLYYGDEIGMGDNIYLGDRDGVRTPMQWGSGRNAGFSHGNPQSLYLPVIIDPEYHCDAVNVEAQQNNAFSFLWWMKRIIALRKQHRVFGRGRIEFLHPSNNKILAFVRQDEDEQILVLANLSRYSQAVELDLSRFRGLSPVELFGQSEFPRVGELPYVLTLGPHGFFWLALREDPRASWELEGHEPPHINVEPTWERIAHGRAKHRLESWLLRWMPHRRWFRSKARKRRSAKIIETVPLRHGDEEVLVAFVRVEYVEGDPELYVLPLGFAVGEDAWAIEASQPQTIVARLTVLAKPGASAVEGVVYDALTQPEFGRIAFEFMRRGRKVQEDALTLEGAPSKALRGARGESLEPRLLSLEQSNSSVVLGDRFILKLFRLVDEGVHPEEEMLRFLTDGGRFEHVPRLMGTLHRKRGRKQEATLAIVQEFVPSDGDAWRLALDLVTQAYDRALEGGHGREAPARPGNLVVQARSGVPPEARELLASFMPLVSQLGQRIAELHLALASDHNDPAFCPEPFSLLHQRSLYQSARALLRRTFDVLAEGIDTLPENMTGAAREVLASRRTIDTRLRRIYRKKLEAKRIRCHGDLHLGQVLHTGRDFMIIDFEGEPARSLGERRFKRSPLRDVAAMMRSFHYAAMNTLYIGRERPEDVRTLRPWSESWADWASVAFLSSWLTTFEPAGVIPSDDEELCLLLEFYLLEKCIYEVGYELDNRPEWVGVPLSGLRTLLHETSP